MKHIGIIGVSSEGAGLCFQTICSESAKLTGSYTHPEITMDFLYVDNAAVQLIRNPSIFDVIVTSNLFGDILSDIASVLPGSLGLMPSACIGDRIHLFEPMYFIVFSRTDLCTQGPRH